MPNTEPFITRRTLTTATVIQTALGDLTPQASSPADIWRLLTERYVVDLDAVATVLPAARPEPVWLSPRR